VYSDSGLGLQMRPTPFGYATACQDFLFRLLHNYPTFSIKGWASKYISNNFPKFMFYDRDSQQFFGWWYIMYQKNDGNLKKIKKT